MKTARDAYTPLLEAMARAIRFIDTPLAERASLGPLTRLEAEAQHGRSAHRDECPEATCQILERDLGEKHPLTRALALAFVEEALRAWEAAVKKASADDWRPPWRHGHNWQDTNRLMGLVHYLPTTHMHPWLTRSRLLDNYDSLHDRWLNILSQLHKGTGYNLFHEMLGEEIQKHAGFARDGRDPNRSSLLLHALVTKYDMGPDFETIALSNT